MLPQLSSVPFFTASAAACSGVWTILWFFQMSTIAQQSDITYPLNPQSRRRVSSSRNWLALADSP